jgi:2-hydroxychromene-2-carboxylate isomerase
MIYRSQLEMSSEVARDVIWALRTAGADLTADEVILRIADSLGLTRAHLAAT